MRAACIPADEQFRLIMECRVSGLAYHECCMQNGTQGSGTCVPKLCILFQNASFLAQPLLKTDYGEYLKLIEPKLFGDARGYFYEVYNYNDYVAAGMDMQFVRDNQSSSKKGVIRGLHFQKLFPQEKLVRASKGTVFDVAVDLGDGSKTFGKWYGVELSDENKKQFFIPKNFAHGFAVLSA